MWRIVSFRLDSFRRCRWHIRPTRLHSPTQIHRVLKVRLLTPEQRRHHIFLLGVNVLLVADFIYHFLFCNDLSFFHTKKFLKHFIMIGWIFPLRASPLWLSIGRVSFYWWEVRWSEAGGLGGGGGRGSQRDEERVDRPQKFDLAKPEFESKCVHSV